MVQLRDARLLRWFELGMSVSAVAPSARPTMKHALLLLALSLFVHPSLGQSPTEIYWIELFSGRLGKTVDGASETLLSGLSLPEGIALDESGRIYWVEDGTQSLNRVDADGSNPVTLLTGLGSVRALDVSGGVVVWVDDAGNKVQGALLSDLIVFDIAIASDGVDLPRGVALGQSLGGNSGWVYWADEGTDSIFRSTLDGSQVELVASVFATGVHALAIDPGGVVFWGDRDTDAIYRLSPGGAVAKIADANDPRALWAGETHVYWAESGSGNIVRSDFLGGSPTVVVSGLANPWGVAVKPAGPPPSAPRLIAPENGATVEAGDVAFSWEGSPTSTYRLQVAGDGAFTDLLVDADVFGTFRNVPGLQAGSTYFWRVRFIEFSDVFTFSTQPDPLATIVITSPANGDTWIGGTKQLIRWNRDSIPDTGCSNARITLVGDATTEVLQRRRASRSQKWAWRIPPEQLSGRYRIRLDCKGSKVFGLSAHFSIEGPPDPSIFVVAPVSGDVWPKRSKQTTRWTFQGISRKAKVQIVLVDASGRETILARRYAIKKGAKGFRRGVPRSVRPGSYTVVVRSGDVSGRSEPFEIVRAVSGKTGDLARERFFDGASWTLVGDVMEGETALGLLSGLEQGGDLLMMDSGGRTASLGSVLHDELGTLETSQPYWVWSARGVSGHPSTRQTVSGGFTAPRHWTPVRYENDGAAPTVLVVSVDGLRPGDELALEYQGVVRDAAVISGTGVVLQVPAGLGGGLLEGRDFGLRAWSAAKEIVMPIRLASLDVLDGIMQDSTEVVSVDRFSDLVLAGGDVVRLVASVGDSSPNPESFVLEGNYPNPFNPSTVIRFALPEQAEVRLAVFDMLGRQVALLIEGPLDQGFHERLFDASVLASGTYMYVLRTGSEIQSRTMLLVR
jgi:hypothetical protein